MRKPPLVPAVTTPVIEERVERPSLGRLPSILNSSALAITNSRVLVGWFRSGAASKAIVTVDVSMAPGDGRASTVRRLLIIMVVEA